MLHLYYGRENIDKENFIFDHLQGRALLLVPDQFTLQMERALLARAIAVARGCDVDQPRNLAKSVTVE